MSNPLISLERLAKESADLAKRFDLAVYWNHKIKRDPEVRVLRCRDPQMWYANRVGETIRIEKVDVEGLWAREGGMYNAINVIKFEDVES